MVKVTVTNPHKQEIGAKLVEIPIKTLPATLRTGNLSVSDGEGKQVVSQLTHDSLLLFKADVKPGKKAVFKIAAASVAPTFESTTSGRLYEKRRDDISYENEVVGFRIYGPGTQEAGEKAYGYDIFFKHPTTELIVPLLYAPETDDAVWAKVDSLRKISPAMADSFINTFSYHIDHGLGMDCYAVGSTLGAGVAALATSDTIYYPWCYDSAEILDNGPLRFTLQLNFAPVAIGNDREVTEHRLISLDSESHLNKTAVWYDGLSVPMEILAGFPLRDASNPAIDPLKRYIAYSDPTQGPDNGRAMLGIVVEEPAQEIVNRDNHILVKKPYHPSDRFNYYWGFAWDRADIDNFGDWENYLKHFPLEYKVKITK